MLWPVNHLANETINWRAGCGKSASPVRREGGLKSFSPSYPINMSRLFAGVQASTDSSRIGPWAGVGRGSRWFTVVCHLALGGRSLREGRLYPATRLFRRHKALWLRLIVFSVGFGFLRF